MERLWCAERFALEVLLYEGGIMEIRRHGRYWAVYDAEGTLVVLAVYKKGAAEVVRRLTAVEAQASGPGKARPEEAAGPVEPVKSRKPLREQKRRIVRQAQDGDSTPDVAAYVVAEGGGQTRHLGTITIRVDVLFEGDTHRQ